MSIEYLLKCSPVYCENRGRLKYHAAKSIKNRDQRLVAPILDNICPHISTSLSVDVALKRQDIIGQVQTRYPRLT